MKPSRQDEQDKDINIRPAISADIPFMANLERQCATAGHWTDEQYRQAFETEGPKRFMIVAAASDTAETAAGQRILGFLIAQHVAPEWELENIVVAPEARRKGAGKQLLEALLAVARETNSDSIFLEVRESNAAARTLYNQAAFEQTGIRKFYYLDPSENAILYRRILS
jgi:ribosomal-protein-alanine N-acetyltransferase